MGLTYIVKYSNEKWSIYIGVANVCAIAKTTTLGLDLVWRLAIKQSVLPFIGPVSACVANSPKFNMSLRRWLHNIPTISFGQPCIRTAAFVAEDINLLSGFRNIPLYTMTWKGIIPWDKQHGGNTVKAGQSRSHLTSRAPR